MPVISLAKLKKEFGIDDEHLVEFKQKGERLILLLTLPPKPTQGVDLIKQARELFARRKQMDGHADFFSIYREVREGYLEQMKTR